MSDLRVGDSVIFRGCRQDQSNDETTKVVSIDDKYIYFKNGRKNGKDLNLKSCWIIKVNGKLI